MFTVWKHAAVVGRLARTVYLRVFVFLCCFNVLQLFFIFEKIPGACGELASDASDALLRFYLLQHVSRVRNPTTPNIAELNDTIRYDAMRCNRYVKNNDLFDVSNCNEVRYELYRYVKFHVTIAKYFLMLASPPFRLNPMQFSK